MRAGLVAATALLVSAIGISTWISAAEYLTIPPDGDFHERRAAEWTLTGPDATALRRDTFRRATFIVPASFSPPRPPVPNPLGQPVPSCRFLPSELSGTTPKFDRELDNA